MNPSRFRFEAVPRIMTTGSKQQHLSCYFPILISHFRIFLNKLYLYRPRIQFKMADYAPPTGPPPPKVSSSPAKSLSSGIELR